MKNYPISRLGPPSVVSLRPLVSHTCPTRVWHTFADIASTASRNYYDRMCNENISDFAIRTSHGKVYEFSADERAAENGGRFVFLFRCAIFLFNKVNGGFLNGFSSVCANVPFVPLQLVKFYIVAYWRVRDHTRLLRLWRLTVEHTLYMKRVHFLFYLKY